LSMEELRAVVVAVAGSVIIIYWQGFLSKDILDVRWE
jgi:hypothetical protein